MADFTFEKCKQFKWESILCLLQEQEKKSELNMSILQIFEYGCATETSFP